MLTIIYVILMIPAMVVGWLAVGYWLHDYLKNK
jgi:hypothetical protein